MNMFHSYRTALGLRHIAPKRLHHWRTDYETFALKGRAGGLRMIELVCHDEQNIL